MNLSISTDGSVSRPAMIFQNLPFYCVNPVEQRGCCWQRNFAAMHDKSFALTAKQRNRFLEKNAKRPGAYVRLGQACTLQEFNRSRPLFLLIHSLAYQGIDKSTNTKWPWWWEAPDHAIPADVVKAAVQAPTIYFAGYNDGVAEELTSLKTNEITVKIRFPWRNLCRSWNRKVMDKMTSFLWSIR